MFKNNFLMGVGVTLALIGIGTSAFAQSVSPPAPARTAPAAQATTDPSSSASFVVLADFAKPCDIVRLKDEKDEQWEKRQRSCDMPRAARPSTISGDSPVVSRERFIKDYPQLGAAGYDRIAYDNEQLCGVAREFMGNLQSLDQLFSVTGDEYELILAVYQELPDSVKKTTTVMTVAQAAQAGALCALSAGLYCIAVVAGGIGNIFTSQTNKKLQLANIRLSVANIVLTKFNIYSNRLTLRMDGLWLKAYAPACKRLGYDTPSGLDSLPALPTLPVGFVKK